VEHLGPVPDDPGVLHLRAHHEPGHVLKKDERHVERVADLDEVSGLVGGVVVEDAAEVHRLVGDHADALASDAGEARDDAAREAGFTSKISPPSTTARSSLYMS